MTAADHFQRGLEHLKRTEFAPAVEAFEAAYAADPSLLWAPINVGLALTSQKRYDEALRSLARVIAVAPQNVHAINAIGNIYLAMADHPSALRAFDAALQVEQGDAALHYNRALALHHIGLSEEAAQSYRRAISIEPSAAEMHSGLAAVLTLLGDFAGARVALSEALKLRPKDPEILRRWFDLEHVAVNDPHVKVLRSLMKNASQFSIRQRVLLEFSSAKVESDLGNHDAAFDHFVAGNALLRTTYDYDVAAEIGLYAAAIHTFTPELLQAKARQGHLSDAPIFIVGMPRSGTTLVEQVLATHPSVTPGGEHNGVFQVTASATQQLHLGYPYFVPKLTSEQLFRMGTAYLATTGNLQDAPRFTDKMPLNVLYTGLIYLMFPNARIVHVRRDAVDTCISCFTNQFSDLNSFTCDLSELGQYYRGYDCLSNHWRSVLPHQVYLEVQYEELVNDLEAQARRLLAFLDLDWDPRVLNFHTTQRSVRTASVHQVRKPIYTSSIGSAYRRYGERLRPLVDALEGKT